MHDDYEEGVKCGACGVSLPENSGDSSRPPCPQCGATVRRFTAIMAGEEWPISERLKVGDTLVLAFPMDVPGLLLQSAVIQLGKNVAEGAIVEAVTLPWQMILREFIRTPNLMYEVNPRKMEELIAGVYKEAGYDEVILTPRSGDHGRDIIATRRGQFQVRIFDQVKKYAPDHRVTADEVRSAIGVLASDLNMTKAFVTTTSDFAPKINDDPRIASMIPFRLELRNGARLLEDMAKLLKRI